MANIEINVVGFSEEGHVYSCGSDYYGCLGHNQSCGSTVCLPTQLTALSDQCVTQVASGSAHVLALTDTGALYSWGSGEYGGWQILDDNEQN